MPAPSIRSSEDEVIHREMERVSLDWCMIYNPTNDDFYIEWAAKDGKPWKYLVPSQHKDIGFGQGKLEIQRYLAIWYCKHMKDKIINEKGKAQGEKMLAQRAEKGMPELTKFEEQKAVWDKTPRTSSNKELAALYPILFLGVTREFGMDYGDLPEPMGVDIQTPEEKILEGMKNRKYTPPSPKKKSTPLPSVDELETLIKDTNGA